MPDSLRGKAAIVGIGELKPERARPGRNAMSLLAEAAYLAIQDAGLRKSDIDGMIVEPPLFGGTSGFNPAMAEYLGIYPTWATGCDGQGAAGVAMALQAAAYVNAGLATYVLCGVGAPSDRGGRGARRMEATETATTEFSVPFGPTVGANGSYAMIAKRHEHLYGTMIEKRAKVSVDLRYSGGCAFIVTRADIAWDVPHKAAYILGGGLGITHASVTHVSEITVAPVGKAAPQAFALAGVGPSDVQVMEIYDSFTITVLCQLEDAGFCKKGEAGDWVQAHDLTFKGDRPLNTHGGNLSYGQAATAGGCGLVTEAVRQIRREAGDHQVSGPTDVAFVTGFGGQFSQQAAMVLCSGAAL
jgi:acetyl-CoA acetyltransferase